jgi:hypothetical protein
MTGEVQYDQALVAALRIISKLEERPLMTREAKLATVTFDLLDAIHAAVAVRCRPVTEPGGGPGVPDATPLPCRRPDKRL